MVAGAEPGLGLRGDKSINFFFFLKLQINIHLINHQQRKIHKIIVFLRYKNAIIYENGTLDFPQH